MSSTCNSDGGAIPQEGWFALYTRHQHEKNAEQILRNKGFDTFLPLYRTTHQWKDRKKELWLPLFPCYVFLNGGSERGSDVLRTPGVVAFVAQGGQPAMIPADQMHAVRQVVQRTRVEPHPFLQAGDKVRVRAGSLSGIEGILVRKKNECRLVISVDMLGQSVATEIDGSVVERLERRSASAGQWGRLGTHPIFDGAFERQVTNN